MKKDNATHHALRNCLRAIECRACNDHSARMDNELFVMCLLASKACLKTSIASVWFLGTGFFDSLVWCDPSCLMISNILIGWFGDSSSLETALQLEIGTIPLLISLEHRQVVTIIACKVTLKHRSIATFHRANILHVFVSRTKPVALVHKGFCTVHNIAAQVSYCNSIAYNGPNHL